jgi:hypothetical protein
MMVHFEHANIALGAMVAPVWLRPQAPLAHPDASILLALEGQLRQGWPLEEALALALGVERTSLALDVSVV